MTAQILPFRRVRDRRFVIRHAQRMAELPSTTAQKYLANQIDVQRATLIRRGTHPDCIEPHLRALEGAIRSELWSAVCNPGSGGAA